MKKQAFNPYLPSYEYVPDGEPHVFGDRLYIYGSHDKFNGKRFCENDYVAWSTPVDNLADWRYEGVIYKKTQDIDNANGDKVMYAPDVARGVDGKYYLYYGLENDNKIGVAVCDSPAGEYHFLGCVQDKNGEYWGRRPQDFMPFDPGILVDNGRVYLYAGQGPMMEKMAKSEYKRHFRDSSYFVELETDMLTMKQEPVRLLPNIMDSAGTGFENHEFFEANSIRKFDDKYYFIYSSVQSHELCWAVSDRPDGDFTYGGVLTSNGDVGPLGFTSTKSYAKPLGYEVKNYIGNNHGSVEKVKDRYYVFGHRHTARNMFSRQGYAEEIKFKNGKFEYAELTSCGLNDGPLMGVGEYEARIACHLYSKKGPTWSAHKLVQNKEHPAFMQDGLDREDNPNQYIQNMKDGAVAGFRYFDFENYEPDSISVKIRGKANGYFYIYDDADKKNILGKIAIVVNDKKNFCCVKDSLTVPKKNSALYFEYKGKGYLDFYSFELKQMFIHITKEPNVMAQGMSWIKTNMKLAMNTSDETLAELMTDGCNMGVKSLSRYLNQYKAADDRAKAITKKLINFSVFVV